MSSARPQQNKPLGIALRLGAAASFSGMAASIKLAYEAGVGTPELVFYRFAFGLPPLLAWIVWSGDYGIWRTERPLAHLWRAFAGLTSMVLAFTALYYLPLAESTTIGFAAPFFAVMLSVLIFKEKVGRHRWSAVALGFVGVLIVMRPDGSHLPLIGLVLALLSALGVGIITITIRQIGKTEATQTIVLWFTLISMAATGPLLFVYGEVYDLETWIILLAVGTCGGLGQLFLTSSLRYAPVPVIVPFDYSQLLWAVLLGWLIWETQPLPSTWAGGALIIASGLYTLYREHRLGREAARPAPPL